MNVPLLRIFIFSSILCFGYLNSLKAQNALNADSLENELKRSGKSDSAKINDLIKLSEIYSRNREKNQKAYMIALNAKNIANQLGNEVTLADALYVLGLAEIRIGQGTEGLKHLKSARNIYEQNNLKLKLANTQMELGKYYRNNANFSKAADMYLESVLTYSLENVKLKEAEAMMQLGEIQIDLGNTENEARDNLSKAIKIFKSNNKKPETAKALRLLAYNYLNKSDFGNAISNALEAKDRYNELGDVENATNVQSLMVQIYEKQGRKEVAQKLNAETRNRKENLKEESLENPEEHYHQLGLLYKSYNIMSSSKYNFEKSNEFAKQSNSTYYVQKNMYQLSEVYQNLGETDIAFEYLKQYSRIRDSIAKLVTGDKVSEASQQAKLTKLEDKNQNLETTKKIVERDLSLSRLLIVVSILGALVMAVLLILLYRDRNAKRIINKKLEVKSEEVVSKNLQLQQKTVEITDSLNYAKRIQSAILPLESEVISSFKDAFVFYNPKDIVCGDFYWFSNFGKFKLIASVDCTGHGVPGAFLTFLSFNLLNQIVNQQGVTKPSLIIHEVRKGLFALFNQSNKSGTPINDGLDMSLCFIDETNRVIQYSGVYNPLWLVRNNDIKFDAESPYNEMEGSKGNKLYEIKGDNIPINDYVNFKPYSNHIINFEPNDILYLFTDGYADQFGGPKGKKFKYKQMQHLFLDMAEKDLSDQKSIVENTFNEWKGDLDQIDDICVIGIKL
jgi:serine phosphatase RsbU (regulator of sigma subunit)